VAGDENAQGIAEAIARRSYGKLVAYVAARTRDVAAAEDALADAFAAALEDWPRIGCPENPEAWLLTVARRKWIDAARRRSRESDDDPEEMAAALEAAPAGAEIADRRLALLFACAHPAIEESVRAPLMLQVILGLDAARVGSAFLMSPAAMGKRLVRAKTKIREAGIPFRVPERGELAERLEAVLSAIYAGYTEGWADAAGMDGCRRDLSEETIFLAGMVAELLPQEPEALGLFALLLYAEGRRRARRDDAGAYVPFERQDLARWDWTMIAEAEGLLLRASAAGRIGRYQLEAALQSAHVLRRQTGTNNWADVVRLYDGLFALTASPVVAINRALALAEAENAEAGLRAMPDEDGDARLDKYQPYWAARAELLARTGASAEALHAYAIAIGLERDDAIRRFLEERRAALQV
jgi:RNA polymerase sigma-70 factor (ECF subfamily)